MAVMFILQYLLFILNLSQETSAGPYPEQFGPYPKNRQPHDLSIKYAIPLFFHYEAFRHLPLSYLLGIGVDNNQVENLFLDFLNLYFVSMYILHYRNPLLVKSMAKVFWSFPSAFESKEKWDRLKSKVRK